MLQILVLAIKSLYVSSPLDISQSELSHSRCGQTALFSRKNKTGEENLNLLAVSVLFFKGLNFIEGRNSSSREKSPSSPYAPLQIWQKVFKKLSKFSHLNCQVRSHALLSFMWTFMSNCFEIVWPATRYVCQLSTFSKFSTKPRRNIRIVFSFLQRFVVLNPRLIFLCTLSEISLELRKVLCFSFCPKRLLSNNLSAS